MASDVVDESAVYLTTGNPLPADIESVINWLLNEPFVTAFHSELHHQTYSIAFLVVGDTWNVHAIQAAHVWRG